MYIERGVQHMLQNVISSFTKGFKKNTLVIYTLIILVQKKYNLVFLKC